MHSEKKQNSEIYKALLRQIGEVRSSIENTQEHMAFKSSILRILLAMENDLNQDLLDVSNLNKNADGIFRLVTESAKLEKSPIGKELLSILEKLHDFLTETTTGI